MKRIIFDSGPLISLTMANLLWVLEKAKERCGSEFCIVPEVKREVIDKPLFSKRFRFDAIQILSLLNKGTLVLLTDGSVQKRARELLEVANGIFSANGKPLQIVQEGEMSALAAALLYEADAFVVDERITRYLAEDPHAIRDVLESRLHQRIEFDDQLVHEFAKRLGNLPIIRSTEIAMRCYELGFFNDVLPKIKDARTTLVDAVLWKLKLSGAAIAEREINEYEKLLTLKVARTTS